AVAFVAEVEEKLAAIGLDPLLRFGEVVDLEAEMMRADEGRALLEIGRRAAGLALKIEQREIDHAVAHVDRGTDVQILAADALEVEHVGVELRRLVEILHADCKVAQTCHRILLALAPSPAIIAPAPWRGLPSIARCHRMAPGNGTPQSPARAAQAGPRPVRWRSAAGAYACTSAGSACAPPARASTSMRTGCACWRRLAPMTRRSRARLSPIPARSATIATG